MSEFVFSSGLFDQSGGGGRIAGSPEDGQSEWNSVVLPDALESITDEVSKTRAAKAARTGEGESLEDSGGEGAVYVPNLSLIVSQDQTIEDQRDGGDSELNQGEAEPPFVFPKPAEWNVITKRSRFSDVRLAGNALKDGESERNSVVPPDSTDEVSNCLLYTSPSPRDRG